MTFWVSGDMSEDLRIKKLRGSGGFVMAQVTDDQQRKGNLGGPDLFLAPIGRLVKKLSKSTLATLVIKNMKDLQRLSMKILTKKWLKI